MDGRNSAGRKISLLNDSSDVAAASTSNIHHFHHNNSNSIPRIHPTKIQLPPIHAHSRASSSCSTTPSLSPQTPQLSRSSSSDSRAFQTPSPVTPSFEPNFTTSHSAPSAHYRFPHQPPRQHSSSSTTSQHHPLHLHHRQASTAHKSQSAQHYYLLNHSSGKMDESQLYPPLPDVQTLGFAIPQSLTPQMPILPMQQAPLHRSSDSPSSEPSRVSAVSGTSTSNNNSSSKPQQPKKNQYPCPLAKQYNCSDFFTTSGHAARHAKKHTGKKDAFCPECNKAFTRKDNMEQHRRTHQNGRGGSRSTAANNDDAKVKKSTKQSSKKVNVKAEPQLEAAVNQELAEQQAVAAQAQAQAAAAQAQVHVAQQQAQQQQIQPQHIEPALMMPVSGPYFLGGSMDTGPVPPLPMAMPELGIRPPLHRTTLSNNLDFMPTAAPMTLTEDALHYSYPSPGLSNGLNSLALAASEHQRRLSEEKAQSQSPPSETPTPP